MLESSNWLRPTTYTREALDLSVMKVRTLPLVCNSLSFNELFLLTIFLIVVYLTYDKQNSTILCDECVRSRPSRYP